MGASEMRRGAMEGSYLATIFPPVDQSRRWQDGTRTKKRRDRLRRSRRIPGKRRKLLERQDELHQRLDVGIFKE